MASRTFLRTATIAKAPFRSQFLPSTLPRIIRRNMADDAKPTSEYQFIKTDIPKAGVARITLYRPKAYNALSTPLFKELNSALLKYDQDDTIGAIVIMGEGKAFAAGADIKEMANLTVSEAYSTNFIALWSETITKLNKPTIAAVTGFALGGGCELAMMCDILYASKSAQFGQPEIRLGTIPGAGGSQRLTRALGKSKAMELILTGKSFSGEEAERWGLAAGVFDTPELTVEAAIETASVIAGYSRVAVKACKEVVNQSQELALEQGVKYERKVFHTLFGTEDQKIGMNAFASKKEPVWVNK